MSARIKYKKAILLLNVGTPNNINDINEIKNYLSNFLLDRWVVDMPHWLWKPILKNKILKNVLNL